MNPLLIGWYLYAIFFTPRPVRDVRKTEDS
jgi:hypothetical protein